MQPNAIRNVHTWPDSAPFFLKTCMQGRHVSSLHNVPPVLAVRRTQYSVTQTLKQPRCPVVPPGGSRGDSVLNWYKSVTGFQIQRNLDILRGIPTSPHLAAELLFDL